MEGPQDSGTSSQEEDQSSQLDDKEDRLPSGMEKSPMTINASGDGMEEGSIHMLTGSGSNTVIIEETNVKDIK